MRRFFSRFSSDEREVKGRRSISRNSPEDLQRSSSSKSNSPVHNNGVGNNQPNWEFLIDLENGSSNLTPGERWTTSAEFASDPGAWETQMEISWERLDKLLRTANNGERGLLAKVCEELSTICKLLVVEVNSQSEPSIGPILEQFFNEEILLRVQRWTRNLPHSLVLGCQMRLIRIFDNMINCCQCPQSLLVHKPILIPLLQLLQWCKRWAAEESLRLEVAESNKYLSRVGVDKCFVQLVNQICRKIAADDTLLHFFFHSSIDDDEMGEGKEEKEASESADQSGKNGCQEKQNDRKDARPFLLFDFLISYIYAPEEEVYLYARDALLLIVATSKEHLFVADYVAHKSNFCPVLAGGLSACFSQLPNNIFKDLHGLGLDLDEFAKLTASDVKALPELCEFHNGLLFTNSIVHIAQQDITLNIIHFFYAGFLLKVFKSSVLERFSSSSQSELEEELCSRIVYFHLCVDTISEAPFIHSMVHILVVADIGQADCNLLELLLRKMHLSERLCRVTLSLVHTLLLLRCEDLLWAAVFRHLVPVIPLRARNQSRRFDVSMSWQAAEFFLSCIPQCTRHIIELNSAEQFDKYLRDASEAVRDCELACACWALKYDGSTPPSLFQYHQNGTAISSFATDENMLSAKQPFVRLSSTRSSFASTGWNRYFRENHSSHGTLLDGTTNELGQLNDLGNLGEAEQAQKEREADDPLILCTQLLDGNNSCSQEDFSDFNPYYDEIHDPRLDYFQFAYEGLSEDEPLDITSRKNSEAEDGNAFKANGNDNLLSKRKSTPVISRNIAGGRTKSAITTTTDTNSSSSLLMKEVQKREWKNLRIKGREYFIALLDTISMSAPSDERETVLPRNESAKEPPQRVEKSLALTDARWQHLEELRKEKLKEANRPCKEENPFRLDLSATTADSGVESSAVTFCEVDANTSMSITTLTEGMPMLCESKGSGLLLESLLELISQMPAHNFATNMQLCAVLNALLAFPQPLLTTFLLYADSLRSRTVFRITDALIELKAKIDDYAARYGGDEFEQMVRRGLRNRHRKEQQHQKKLAEDLDGSRRTDRRRSILPGNGSNGGFHFTHRAVAAKEQQQQGHIKEEDSNRRRTSYAYAAILLTQLCQQFAAFSFQHSPAAILQQQIERRI